MDKCKKIIKENLLWLIILIILIFIVIGYWFIDFINGKKIYSDPMLNKESVPYIPYKYSANEYKVVTVEFYDIINDYYKYFIDKVLNDPKSSWDLLSDDTKKEMFFNDYKEYQSYIKSIITVNTKGNSVVKYSVDNDGIIKVIDSENYMYEIKESGVWKFTIAIKVQVR